MVGLGFEETKLRLGLPGGGKVEADEEAGATARSSRKRGFAETIDLKLNPEPASAAAPTAGDEEVADGVAGAGVGQMKRSPSQSSVVTTDPERPRAPKAHRSSFRKNILAGGAGEGERGRRAVPAQDGHVRVQELRGALQGPGEDVRLLHHGLCRA